MTVILDCNIWITLTINGQFDFIGNLFDKDIIIASCDDLKREIENVLNRPKIKRYISDEQILKMVELHDLATTFFKPGKILPVTKDPLDDYLFALAVKSKTDYLVTGDKLLLDVGVYKNTNVIALSDFRKLVDS
jgi:putative PIN family toxin of toxin-antitoxin system